MSTLVIAWIVVTLLAWRPIGGHLAWLSGAGNDSGELDSFDIFLVGGLAGLICAATMPVWLSVMVAYKAVAKSAGLAGMALPVIGAEKAMLEKKRIEELKRLEKELGYAD